MREILDYVADIGRARELFRMQEQILSAVAEPNGAISTEGMTLVPYAHRGGRAQEV